jgi:hypothetical protein
MTVDELRTKRVAAEIPATLLASKAKINRCRLSNIECRYLQPSGDELERLSRAPEELIEAREVIRQAANTVGWPRKVLR